jgi:hypothetical protein
MAECPPAVFGTIQAKAGFRRVNMKKVVNRQTAFS